MSIFQTHYLPVYLLFKDVYIYLSIYYIYVYIYIYMTISTPNKLSLDLSIHQSNTSEVSIYRRVEESDIARSGPGRNFIILHIITPGTVFKKRKGSSCSTGNFNRESGGEYETGNRIQPPPRRESVKWELDLKGRIELKMVNETKPGIRSEKGICPVFQK